MQDALIFQSLTRFSSDRPTRTKRGIKSARLKIKKLQEEEVERGGGCPTTTPIFISYILFGTVFNFILESDRAFLGPHSERHGFTRTL